MGNGAGTSEGELFQTHIGGSAVTEGVMMRGRCGWAVSVRTPSDEMYVEEHPLPGASERPAWQRLPLVRGCVSAVVLATRLVLLPLVVGVSYEVTVTWHLLLLRGICRDAPLSPVPLLPFARARV